MLPLFLFPRRWMVGLSGKRVQFLFAIVVACFIFFSSFDTVSRSQAVPANQVSSSSELREGFQHPPMAARTMVRWWWPGGDVTDEEISRELRTMKEAGIGGVEIQPSKLDSTPSPHPRWQRASTAI
jgi:hypothetical protein